MNGPARSGSDPATRPAPRGLLLLLAAALALAVGLQLLPYPAAVTVPRDTPLADYLPLQAGGWIGEDRPIAETEALVGAVQETINYREALLRAYRKDAVEFTVYLAYWEPGRMSSREIAFHIPDKCWTSVGWKRTAADYHDRRDLAGLELAPAQFRIFEAGEQRQHVLYWHIFNGRTILYNPDGSPGDLTMLTDLLHRGLRQKGEQYFIRIASNTPLENLWPDRGFLEIMELVAQLGPGLTSEIDYFEAAPPAGRRIGFRR
jgi:Protein of unknown function (DUF3485)